MGALLQHSNNIRFIRSQQVFARLDRGVQQVRKAADWLLATCLLQADEGARAEWGSPVHPLYYDTMNLFYYIIILLFYSTTLLNDCYCTNILLFHTPAILLYYYTTHLSPTQVNFLTVTHPNLARMCGCAECLGRSVAI